MNIYGKWSAALPPKECLELQLVSWVQPHTHVIPASFAGVFQSDSMHCTCFAGVCSSVEMQLQMWHFSLWLAQRSYPKVQPNCPWLDMHWWCTWKSSVSWAVPPQSYHTWLHCSDDPSTQTSSAWCPAMALPEPWHTLMQLWHRPVMNCSPTCLNSIEYHSDIRT